MASLNNPKHEVYCQQRAKGHNKSESARNAGYAASTAGVIGCNLEKRQEIRERIKELSDRGTSLAVADVALSKEWVLTRLMALEQIAKNKQQVSAATRCVELIGRELGMFQDVIPREMFNLMMAAMGQTVTRFVPDASVLEKIVGEWERISIAEPRQLRAGILPHSVTDPQSAE